ncbi:MAG TPA: cytochrome c [Opitutaceae bacterium]|jgi:cytochrome c553|nr:cytochrome c [Opitutaceae bacterium]
MNLQPVTLVAALTLALPAAARADAPAQWNTLCASCHGKDGAGHTRAGHLLGVKDLTSADYQKSFTDDAAFADIKNGLKKDGRVKMKPFSDRLSDADIRALIAYVRSLAH